RVNVTTNARMASYDAFAERLCRSGVTSILTSIHGPDAQIHAQNVGVAEAFDQTCAGVRNMVRLAPHALPLPAPLPPTTSNPPRPRINPGPNITITKSNPQNPGPVPGLVYSLGLRWFTLQSLPPFGRATSSVCPDTAEAAAVAMRVIDEYRDRMKFQVINLPF